MKTLCRMRFGYCSTLLKTHLKQGKGSRRSLMAAFFRPVPLFLEYLWYNSRKRLLYSHLFGRPIGHGQFYHMRCAFVV